MLLSIIAILLWVGSIIFWIIRNLYIKNEKLEKIIESQLNTLSNLSTVINQSDKLLKEWDSKKIYSTDDETGTFFKMIKEIQDMLNQFLKR